jgi:hypothetical protein
MAANSSGRSHHGRSDAMPLQIGMYRNTGEPSNALITGEHDDDARRTTTDVSENPAAATQAVR